MSVFKAGDAVSIEKSSEIGLLVARGIVTAVLNFEIIVVSLRVTETYIGGEKVNEYHNNDKPEISFWESEVLRYGGDFDA